jgi:hypothetical protein
MTRLCVTLHSFFFLLFFWFRELCAIWELASDLVLVLGGFFFLRDFQGDTRLGTPESSGEAADTCFPR